MPAYPRLLLATLLIAVPLGTACTTPSEEVRPGQSQPAQPVPTAAPPQASPAPSQGTAAADNMELVREKIRADKKLFVAQNMQLTAPEATGFWPVYDRYQNDLDTLADRMITLITDYAKNYETMSNGVAKNLIDEYLAIEGDRLKLREAYLPQFRQVLPEKRVVRYYQLENKIQAAVKYELAANIPLFQ